MKILGINLNHSSIILNNCVVIIEVGYFSNTSEMVRKLEEIGVSGTLDVDQNTGMDTVELHAESLKIIDTETEKTEKFSEILAEFARSITIGIARCKS